jgi:hypothetical protein
MLPPGVERIYARADSGFYCGEAVCIGFIVCQRVASIICISLAPLWLGPPLWFLHLALDADSKCSNSLLFLVPLWYPL